MPPKSSQSSTPWESGPTPTGVGKKEESPGKHSEAASEPWTHIEATINATTQMEVDKLEKETGIQAEEALHDMLSHIYNRMWSGNKELTIKAMMAAAQIDEIPAILRFAETIPEDAGPPPPPLPAVV